MSTPRLRTRAAVGMVAAALSVGLFAGPGTASADIVGRADAQSRAHADPGIVPGSYIVAYKESLSAGVGAETSQREKHLGFDSDYVYRSAVKGFAADLNGAQVQALRSDSDVDFVSQNRTVHATGDVSTQASVSLAPGEPTPPTGVRRIRSATTTTVRQAGANTAVIDTGIQLSHPDLNAAAGTDCVDPGTPPDDGAGHGTHVAGTIGAKNNGLGVTGVAPGTKVIAVRVLDNSGSGTWAQVICGIDWVTANKAAQNIQVANMSLGGLGDSLNGQTCATTTDLLRKAICNSTAAGVRYVVAAGNDGWDFDYPSLPNVPAAYPEVLTVSAIADSNGTADGTGPYTSCSSALPDDTPAWFSNYALTTGGIAHTIAAPGVCIKSTVPGSSWSSDYSGTSMASPHVAGVTALCVQENGVNGACAAKTPAQTISYLRSDAQTYNNANPTYGFEGDPISNPGFEYYGFLIRALPPPAVATENVVKSGTQLVFNASAGKSDGLSVTLASGAYRFVNNTAISAGTGCTQVNATTVSCSATGIDQIVANGNDGNDVMNLNGAGAVRATLNGGTGNDTLTGTSLANRFVGEAGADVFNGLGGVDIVSYAERTASQPVVVTLDGVANDGRSGEGDHVKTDVEDVVGGAGADTLKAIAGNAVVNVLNGGAGNDKIRTREGTATADRVICGAGTDQYDTDPADGDADDCETRATIP